MLPAHEVKRRLPIPKGKKHPLFMILGDLLEFMMKQVEIKKNAATGKVLPLILGVVGSLAGAVGSFAKVGGEAQADSGAEALGPAFDWTERCCCPVF